ncbi:MAG: DUF4296 domain-containing protein [Flavobacteriaceae bacterium]|nr:DUF4296 domain-containing protein [Flavobacteriaceae bacterium]
MNRFVKSIPIALIFVSWNCEMFYSSPRPNNLISEEVMTEILFDVAIMDGIRGTISLNETFEDAFNHSYIYTKYDIDSMQLVDSEKYYTSNPKKYLRIHQEVIFRLEMAEDSLEIEDMNQRTE